MRTRCQVCGRELTALQRKHGNGYCSMCSPLQISEEPPERNRWEGGTAMTEGEERLDYCTVALSRADILVLRVALHELRGSEVAVLADEAARVDAVLETVQEQR